MILDHNLFMSDRQPVTDTAASTKSLDLPPPVRNGSEPAELVVQVVTMATSGGTPTVTFALQDSADNSTFATVVQSAPVAFTALNAGAMPLRIPLPAGIRRYVQVSYIVAGGSLTAGAFNAFVNLDREDAVPRPSGFGIAA